MNRYYARAAVNPSAVAAFLRFSAMVYASYDVEYGPSALRLITMYKTQGEEFVRKFKLSKLVDPVYKQLLRNIDPNENDAQHTAIFNMFAELGLRRAELEAEHDITRDQLKFLNDLRLAINGSEAASKRLLRSVSTLGDARLNKFFMLEEDDDKSKGLYADLKALVKRWGKVEGYIIPTEILSEWQAKAKTSGKKLQQHTKYLELRREVTSVYKRALANIVRSSGESYLPLRDVIDELDKKKIIHNLPEGFVGNIDDLGNFYTTAGRKLLQTPSGDVRMNGSYDAEADNAYVCEFTPAFAQAPARAYTVDYRAGARAEKFDVVNEVMPKLDALTKKWLPDMRKLNKSKEGLLAVLCEFVFDTSCRVSSKNAKSAGATTYGATTLLVKHVKLTSSGATITYKGKSGGAQKHKLKFSTPRGRLLGDALTKLVDGKAPTDPVFTFRDQLVTGAMINKYMRGLGFPQKFTIHKLRTARGTKLAMDLLAKCPFKKGQKFKDQEVHKWLDQEILKVGAELGHMSGDKITANTAIANYIDPQILAAFYTKLGIRPNAKVQKAIDMVKKEV